MPPKKAPNPRWQAPALKAMAIVAKSPSAIAELRAIAGKWAEKEKEINQMPPIPSGVDELTSLHQICESLVDSTVCGIIVPVAYVPSFLDDALEGFHRKRIALLVANAYLNHCRPQDATEKAIIIGAMRAVTEAESSIPSARLLSHNLESGCEIATYLRWFSESIQDWQDTHEASINRTLSNLEGLWRLRLNTPPVLPPDPTAEAVLRWMVNPGKLTNPISKASAPKIAEGVKMNEETVKDALGRLRKHELVALEGLGRNSGWYATEAGVRAAEYCKING